MADSRGSIGARMTTSRVSIGLVGVVSAIVIAALCALAAQPSEAKLTVTIEAWDGARVPDVVFRLVRGDTRCEAATDNEGRASFAFTTEDLDSIEIWFGDGSLLGWDAQQQREHRRRLRRFLQTNYFPHLLQGKPVVVQVNGGDFDDEVLLKGERAVSVSGVVVYSGQFRLSEIGWVQARHANRSVAKIADSGHFELTGAQSGVGNEIFVCTYPLVTGVSISAEQSRENVDLGRVDIEDLSERRYGTIDLRVTNRTGSEEGPGGSARSGVTLVSIDGSMVLTFFSDSSGRVIFTEGWTSLPRVPVGTYIVVPESFHGSKLQLGLFDVVRAEVDLSASEIPIISIDEDQTTSLTIDAVEATEAINRLIERTQKR